ncbi:phytanoyl-CoA dioxygenase family protein [Kamptonema cortianum]|nr:phytanoyl-CoA dioxygenase family protein [Oscillatoria laete-virens]MDK3157126.1 phytanoyl-CoA dioxygenase family protein [Kamptonema cortianum]MDL5051102.1 phytanoyl-CoA dioxygenase family protein [Oscillatoria amoena NRMC-F 0135]MDL5055010.1 phytanoyl-CoA dioxygenase family protein [Oscillatoria laete-virens NRMC-F 0139]
MSYKFNSEQIAAFNRDGYVIVRGLFTPEQMELLLRVTKTDLGLMDGAWEMADSKGRKSKLKLWGHAGDDLYGMFSRCESIVSNVETLLGGQVYTFHNKIMMKEPLVGGAWEWHQDYGYWYNDSVLYPQLVSVMVAIDRATKENGCLQVLKGSHLIGRIEHGVAGGQAGADLIRVEAAQKHCDLVYVELEAGDACFFHCNTLHASAANESQNPRWSMICCYNRVDNKPFAESGGHGDNYHPVSKVPDSKILEVGARSDFAAKA